MSSPCVTSTDDVASARLGWVLPLLLACAAAGILLALAAPAHGAVITSKAGPLAQIHVSRDDNLDCQVMRKDWVYSTLALEGDGEFWGTNDCGTFLQVGTFGLYGPATSAGPWTTSYTAVSQTTSGSGTPWDPYAIDTVVDAAPTASTSYRITQHDSYVDGGTFYGTRITVTNSGTTTDTLVLYRAGDCMLTPGSVSSGSSPGFGPDEGYGYLDAARPAAACTEAPGIAAGHVIEFVASDPTAVAEEGVWNTIWSRLSAGTPMAGTCDCVVPEDNGVGLSWSFTLAPGGSKTLQSANVFYAAQVPALPQPCPTGSSGALYPACTVPCNVGWTGAVQPLCFQDCNPGWTGIAYPACIVAPPPCPAGSLGAAGHCVPVPPPPACPPGSVGAPPYACMMPPCLLVTEGLTGRQVSTPGSGCAVAHLP